jgi:hypothetical protein
MDSFKLGNILFVSEMALSSNVAATKLAEELRQLKTKDAIVDFLINNNFRKFGTGAFRTTYDVGNNILLKLDRRDGTANKTELENKQCLSDKFFTKIYAYDEVGYMWLLVEKVQKFTSDEQAKSLLLEKLKGADQDIISTIQLQEDAGDSFEYISTILGNMAYEHDPDIKTNRWMRELIVEIKKCGIDTSDFHIGNWGYRDNGDLVILDYDSTTRPRSVLVEEGYNKALMKKLGYKYVGKNYRLGSDTFVQGDDPNQKRSKMLAKQALKNIEKSNPKRSEKQKHGDPAGVGVSLPRSKVWEQADVDEMAISKAKGLDNLIQQLNSMSANEIHDHFQEQFFDSGTFKTAYDLGDYILKVENDLRDNREIENEVRIKKCAGDKYLAKIYAYSDVYEWIIVEKLKVPEEWEIMKAIKDACDGSGFFDQIAVFEDENNEDQITIGELSDHSFMGQFLKYLKGVVKGPRKVNKPNPWLAGLILTLKKCKISPGDLYPRNWGIRRSTGLPVILDYGYDY